MQSSRDPLNNYNQIGMILYKKSNAIIFLSYCHQKSSFSSKPSNPSNSFPAHADIPIRKCLYGSYFERTASHNQQKWAWQCVHVILLQPCVFWIFALHMGQRFAWDSIQRQESYSWNAWCRRVLPYCFSIAILLSRSSVSHVLRSSFKSDGISLQGDTPCQALWQSRQKQNQQRGHCTMLESSFTVTHLQLKFYFHNYTTCCYYHNIPNPLFRTKLSQKVVFLSKAHPSIYAIVHAVMLRNMYWRSSTE